MTPAQPIRRPWLGFVRKATSLRPDAQFNQRQVGRSRNIVGSGPADRRGTQVFGGGASHSRRVPAADEGGRAPGSGVVVEFTCAGATAAGRCYRTRQIGIQLWPPGYLLVKPEHEQESHR